MVNSPTDGLSDEERLLRQAIDDAFVTTGTTIVPVCAATTPLVATHMRSCVSSFCGRHPKDIACQPTQGEPSTSAQAPKEP
jgi:hypothetical protein